MKNETREGGKMTAPKPQPWTLPRFRLRTLMLVIIPMAAAIVTFAIRFEKAERQRQVVDWIINDEHGHAVYDFGGSPPWTKLNPMPPRVKWADKWLGIDFWHDIHAVALDNQEIDDFRPLFELSELQTIAIYIEILPSADLRSLAKMNNLKALSIDFSSVKQSDLDVIAAALPNCKISVGTNVWLD